MMKWRRRKSGSFDYVDSPASDATRSPSSSDQGSMDEKDFLNLSYNEGETFSPYEDVHLEDLYKRFRIQSKNESSLAELENSLEIYQNNNTTNTPKRQYIREKSNDKNNRSPIILPSIDEHDELLSIADSGISCDADDESDCEEEQRTIGGKQRSYFEPLKCGDDFDYEITEQNEDISLLSCINEELFKRNDSNEFAVKEFEVTEPSENKTEIRNTLQHQDNFEVLENKKQLNRQNLNLDLENTEETEKINITPENLTPLFERNPNNEKTLPDIEMANNHIFNRLKLKADFDHPLHGNMNEQQMPYTLMSSILWNGDTSRKQPSSVEIYSTMPPNRYDKNMTISKPTFDEEDGVLTTHQTEFKVNLDVSHYSPEEILVTLEDGKLVVNGKHFSESEYGFESCQFHRRYPIPEGIKKIDIKSKISEEGILTVTGKRKPEIKVKPNRQASNDKELTSTLKRSKSQDNDEPKTPPKSPSPMFTPTKPNFKINPVENEFYEINANTYLLKVNCNGYKPEDLDVKVSGNELLINGRQKTNSDSKQVKHKEFTRKINIPNMANPESITSKFVQNTLHVEAEKFQRRNSSGNELAEAVKL